MEGRTTKRERYPESCFLAPRVRMQLILVIQTMKFSELIRLLECNGFEIIKEKGSIRYHGAKEIPTGTCNALLKSAGLKGGEK